MKDLKLWFGWIIIMVPIHFAEQLATRLDELYTLRAGLGIVLKLFPNTDFGIVTLVGIASLLMFALSYGILAGGRARLVSLGFFALIACAEIHHIVEVLVNRTYSPGTFSAIPFCLFGVMLMRAIIREYGSSMTVADKSPALADHA